MEFFRVRNFEKFQHYSDRRPPWIKLYRDLWDDPRFFELSEADRYLLVGIFVLASQHDNKVSSSQKWLKIQLLTSRAIPLQRLVDMGWIEPLEQTASIPLHADTVLAPCEPSRARGETETEIQNTETEIQIQKAAALRALLADGFQRIWDRYPVKDGRKEAERHFSASVKTEQDLTDIDVALTNYHEHLKLNDWKRPKGGKTWFNNWRDWVSWVEPENGNGTRSGNSNSNSRAPAVGDRKAIVRPYTPKQ